MNELSEDKSENTPLKKSRPQIETLVWRGMRLKCPRCGEGKIYRSYFKMHDQCSNCSLKFQRGPGYYLGAIYVNYGITALTMTAIFLFLRLVMDIPMQKIIWPSFSLCIILPILLFRHARALWLAFDCQFDRSVLEE